MRIILLGAPGAGKGTQAKFITNRYGIPQISVSDILRNAVEFSPKLDKQIRNVIDSGHLVTDKIVIELMKKYIEQKNYHNGFLIDGFPRTMTQAFSIRRMGIHIDYVIEFKVPYKLIIDRIIGRRIHTASGRIYHIKFNPPKIEGKDDITGEDLIIRTDDQREIINSRLIEYEKMTKPVINFYIEEAKIGNVKYLKLDGTKSIIDIHMELEKKLS